MTADQFKIFWTTTYPGTIPMSYQLRHDYNERWFRIHSLPKAKRYADNETEWKILLDRENEIITDLLGSNSKCIFVTGDFYFEGYQELNPISELHSIENMEFVSLDIINLHKVSPEFYDEGQIFRPIISEQIWNPHKFDKILEDIANDKVKAFFVSIENNSIVAPYDGGMDIILKNVQMKNYYKTKYKNWLSSNQNGL